MQFAIAPLDICVIVAYFISVMLLAVWVSRKKISGGEDYFLAGRQMTWPFIGASLFSTNISSQQFVGQAGLAFVGGIAVGTFQMIGALCFGLLAVFFLDTYRGLKLYTSPEFFERRYNPGTRSLVSFVNVMMIMLATVSAALYAGSVVTLTLLGKAPEGKLLWVAVIVLGAVTGAYTLLGGLRAVIYTDFVQNFLLIVGGVITLVVGIIKVGGLNEVISMRTASGDTMWSLVHPINHEFGWLPVLTGVIILGIHGHCTDQDYIQRALAAKNTFHAKMGAIFAGILKVVALFICAVPGVVAARLFSDMGVQLNQDQAYVSLMIQVLPVGLLGLCLAGLLAAIMSSVDSGLCASSSLLTCDFITKRHKTMDQQRLLKLGRWTILILLVFSILWAPFIKEFKGLFNYLMLLWALMAPPVVVCVLCGLFYDRANAKGAVATLIVGIVLGIVGFLILQKPDVINSMFSAMGSEGFNIKERLHWYFLNKFNIGFLITVICLMTMVVVSKLTGQTEADKEKAAEIRRARESKENDMTPKERKIYIGTMVGLAILWAAVVILFSPWGIGK